jgi:hypothetical protein
MMPNRIAAAARTRRSIRYLRGLAHYCLCRTEKLSYPPCPYAILFMIARSLVHDVKPILAPGWQILVVQLYRPFRYGRKRAKSGSSGKVQGD